MQPNKINLVAAFAYSFLLYHEGIGLNIFLLNILLLGIQFWFKPTKWKERETQYYALAAIVTSVAALLNGHFLSALANVISLLLFSIHMQYPKLSIAGYVLQAMYAYLASPIIKASRYLFKEPKSEESTEELPSENQVNYKLVSIFSALIFFVFLGIYRNMSHGFDQFLKQINLDFLSIPLLFHYAFGSILLGTFFKPLVLDKLMDKESKMAGHLTYKNFNSYNILGINVTEATEQLFAKVIFIGLNLLLFMVNAIDTYHLNQQIMPEGISFSEYVHQGVGALIWSILLAISIILWVFRGSQNFSSNKTIQQLSYTWIGLNIWLVITSAYRNHLYISEEHLFTYKRIGVYIFLFCATFGLALTFYKITNKLSNYFLVRTNTALWFIILVISSLVNWDRIIAEHHISHALAKNKEADLYYLNKLSYSAYPAIAKYNYEVKKAFNESPDMCKLEAHILYQVLSDEKKNYSWKSYNLADSQTFTLLQNLCFK